MITTTNIVREHRPVPEDQKDDPDVVQIQMHRNGYEVEGNFYHTQDPAISHASRGGRRYYMRPVQS
jgi:hypothetical protein